MTEITIQIPSQILIEESQTIDRNKIPLIPATQITGQLTPEQVPVGAIPGLENFEQLDDLLQQVSDRVEQIEQADLVTGPELDDTLEPIGTQLAALETSLGEKATTAQLATLSTALDQISALIATIQTALGGKAATSHNHTTAQVTGLDNALTNLQTQITAASSALQTQIDGKAATDHSHTTAQITGLDNALTDLQDQINGKQAADSDLTALAALATTSFGRNLLTLADLAAAKALLEIPAAGSGSPSVGELTYTISQNSVAAGISALTIAVLTDGNLTTGGGTNTSGANWIKADLGATRTIERLTVAGGTVPTYGTVAGALNNRSVQVSLDDVTWTPLFVLSDVTNAAASTFVLPSSKARYLRIFTSSGGVGTTELRIFGY